MTKMNNFGNEIIPNHHETSRILICLHDNNSDNTTQIVTPIITELNSKELTFHMDL